MLFKEGYEAFAGGRGNLERTTFRAELRLIRSTPDEKVLLHPIYSSLIAMNNLRDIIGTPTEE